MPSKLKVVKGEVVKPEENPVDKAVASVKESRERNQRVVVMLKRNAGNLEKQPKLAKVRRRRV